MRKFFPQKPPSGCFLWLDQGIVFPPPKKKEVFGMNSTIARYTTINLFEQMHIYIYIYIWCGLVDPCSKEWFTWRVTDRDTWSHGIHPTLFTGGLATSGQVELAQDVSFHEPKRVGFPSLKRTARPENWWVGRPIFQGRTVSFYGRVLGGPSHLVNGLLRELRYSHLSLD